MPLILISIIATTLFAVCMVFLIIDAQRTSLNAPSYRARHLLFKRTRLDFEELTELLLLAYRVQELKNQLNKSSIDINGLGPIIEDIIEYLQIKNIDMFLPDDWKDTVHKKLQEVQERFPIERTPPPRLDLHTLSQLIIQDSKILLN